MLACLRWDKQEMHAKYFKRGQTEDLVGDVMMMIILRQMLVK
jgi:hypothetical protein